MSTLRQQTIRATPWWPAPSYQTGTNTSPCAGGHLPFQKKQQAVSFFTQKKPVADTTMAPCADSHIPFQKKQQAISFFTPKNQSQARRTRKCRVGLVFLCGAQHSKRCSDSGHLPSAVLPPSEPIAFSACWRRPPLRQSAGNRPPESR